MDVDISITSYTPDPKQRFRHNNCEASFMIFGGCKEDDKANNVTVDFGFEAFVDVPIIKDAGFGMQSHAGNADT